MGNGETDSELTMVVDAIEHPESPSVVEDDDLTDDVLRIQLRACLPRGVNACRLFPSRRSPSTSLFSRGSRMLKMQTPCVCNFWVGFPQPLPGKE